MIGSGPITSVTWQDVDTFCGQRIQEGANLDYKLDFPANLERTVSAMANTLGGIIIVGVDEDSESRPVLPIHGMELARGLAERVLAVLLSNLTPPIIPEIQVCPNSDSTRAVILIRVPQSPLGPHGISANTKVYIRTGSISSPERLASVDEIQWLVDKRRRSVSLREALHNQFDARFSQFYFRLIDHLLASGISASETTRGILDIRACPTFPTGAFLTPSDLASIYPQIAVPDYYGTDRTFPPTDTYTNTGRPTIVQDGVVFVNGTQDGQRIFYTELNSLGFFGYRQPVRRDDNPSDTGQSPLVLRASEVLVRIDEFLSSAIRFYAAIGYSGFLNLDLSVTDILEVGLRFDWYDSPWVLDHPHGFSPDREIRFSDTLLVQDLPAQKEDIIMRCSRKICWAFGIDLVPSHLEALWNRVRRPMP